MGEMTPPEREFWDRAFCAALAGIESSDLAQQVITEMAKEGGTDAESATAKIAADLADAALVERRKRNTP